MKLMINMDLSMMLIAVVKRCMQASGRDSLDLNVHEALHILGYRDNLIKLPRQPRQNEQILPRND